ncbi:MAG: cytochrome b/b6 domain-containing protein [Paracoccaceae bacterium]
MSLSNTPQSYGIVTKSFHWLTALLILTAIPIGWLAHEMSYALRSGGADAATVARVAMLFSLHKTLGVAAFFVALGRILWAFSQPKPGLLNGNHKLEAILAEVVHWTLYGTMVLVPLSGWVHHAATSGFAPIWWPFGQGLPFVAQSAAVAEASEVVHFLSGRLMIVSIGLHVAGALKHHVIDKDATLRRMLPRGGGAQPSAQQPSHLLPASIAAVLLGATLVAGWSSARLTANEAPTARSSVTAPAPSATVTATSTAPAAANQWQVQEGQIAIAVQQFGSEVSGNFATWQADITYDPQANGQKGAVEVRIDIASLSLGSVTDQALGADFFDAAAHPAAIFAADIIETDGALEAQGTLSIKGNSVPLTLPFTLATDAETAVMQGALRLDRRDFGIGMKMDDESSLGFGVDVTVGLTAVRAP